MVVLVGALLLTRSFAVLLASDPGYDADETWIFEPAIYVPFEPFAVGGTVLVVRPRSDAGAPRHSPSEALGSVVAVLDRCQAAGSPIPILSPRAFLMLTRGGAL